MLSTQMLVLLLLSSPVSVSRRHLAISRISVHRRVLRRLHEGFLRTRGVDAPGGFFGGCVLLLAADSDDGEADEREDYDYADDDADYGAGGDNDRDAVG